MAGDGKCSAALSHAAYPQSWAELGSRGRKHGWAHGESRKFLTPGLWFTAWPWASHFISPSLRSPGSRPRRAFPTARRGCEMEAGAECCSGNQPLAARCGAGVSSTQGSGTLGWWQCGDARPGLTPPAPGPAHGPAFALQNLRVRSTGGTEFFTRSATKFKGALAQKFMFVDGDRAMCGSYR